MAGTVFSHLTDDELINGIKALNIPDYIRSKSYGIDVRETLAQMTEMLMQLAYNQGMNPQQAQEFVYRINNKINKGEVSMTDLSQEVKEALTGGAVAVVGENAVGTENLKNKAVTADKTDFLSVSLSQNLFDINDESYKMGIITGDGIGSSDTYRTSPLMYLDAGTYSFTSPTGYGGNATAIAEYDDSGKAVRYFHGNLEEALDPYVYYTGNRISFTLDHKAYIRTNAGSINGANLSKMTLSKGDSLPSTFVPFEKNVYLKDTLKIPETSYFKDLVTDSISEVPTQNLFNGEHQIGFIQGDAVTNTSGYYSTNKLPLPRGSYLYRIYRQSAYGAGGNNVIVYDTNGNKLGRIVAETLSVDIDKNHRYVTFTLEKDSLVTVNMGNGESELNNWMLVPGSSLSDYPSEYIPYSPFKRSLNRDLSLSENMTKQVTKIVEESEVTSTNPLFGKEIVWNGDSIMAGAGFTGGFAKIISERNEMVSNNYAVGGATITAETITQAGVNRHWISRDVDNMTSDTDYIIFNGGVNDGSLGVEMGTITNGYDNTFDDTTFCGAFESLINKLYEKYPDKKIGFVQVHKMSESQSVYVPKTIEILKKWGVPYIDLYTQAPPLGYITNLKNNYTNNADGWHPNELGYRAFYVDKIESWLKTL